MDGVEPAKFHIMLPHLAAFSKKAQISSTQARSIREPATPTSAVIVPPKLAPRSRLDSPGSGRSRSRLSTISTSTSPVELSSDEATSRMEMAAMMLS